MPFQEKKIYVIGHKNPDTDSVVSAIAYAELKKELGMKNCHAASAGKINHQTQYILDRFNIEKPEMISDLVPKVKHFMNCEKTTVGENTPLWHALELLNKKNLKIVPIVDSNNRYLSVLHYNAFAKNLIEKIEQMKKSIIPTSLYHIMITLNAVPAALFNENEIFDSQVSIAAYESESFKNHIDSLKYENMIVTVGDRDDIQEYVIKKGIRALIVTGNKHVSEKIKTLACNNSVSILVSPYDTSITSMLIYYSSPVRFIGDDTARPVTASDSIDSIVDSFGESISKSLPVVDQDGIVTGMISQGDLAKDPNIEIIMVDHNELSQAVDGLENYRILEIIDHHRLGNSPTNYPITFINKPVGSTSTIIASLFIENNIKISKNIAGIMLSGIMSDTLILRSATATDFDKKIAVLLSEIAGIDYLTLGNDIMTAASTVSKKTVPEILNMDMKKYQEGKFSFTVSQVEVNSMAEIIGRKKEIFDELESVKKTEGTLFSALMVTDITELDSVLFIRGESRATSKILYQKIEDGLFLMKGVLSRKKQLLPLLIEIAKKQK